MKGDLNQSMIAKSKYTVKNQQKNPIIFPPMCRDLASSCVKIPWFVEITKCPNCREGKMELVHFSKSVRVTSYRGEITPTLLIRPSSSITIFFDRWSSITSNSPMQPCFCMMRRNFRRTFDAGLIRTCFLPLRSAFTIVLKQSARMLALVMGWLCGQNNLIFLQILPFNSIFSFSKIHFTFTHHFTAILIILVQNQAFTTYKLPSNQNTLAFYTIQRFMLVPQPEHSGIIVRNFFTIFVTISLLAYIHLGLNEATSTLEDANAIVSALLKNETYTISQQRLFNLDQSLQAKSYHHLAQAECLLKIYLDVINNQKFLDDSKDQPQPQNQQTNAQIQLTFTQLIFPTISHSFQGFRNCSDILTVMNFLNPILTDFIYTKFMQEKYGAFIQDSQNEQKPTSTKTKFCIFTNQFNTSTTKLRQNINSVIDQSYQNYKLIILDNGSTDGSYEIAKVILSDLKDKLKSQNQKQAKAIEKKYQIVKGESRQGLWQLYSKHEQACEGTDFVVFIDGRDSLPTRHTLSILNHQIVSAKEKPWVVTGPILKRKEISRQSPADLPTANKASSIPTYTFKVLSRDLLKQTSQKLNELTLNATHSFEIQKTTIDTLSIYCSSNNKPVLQVDEMMYVYDTLQNKQIDRNEYYVGVVRKQLGKNKKEQRKEEKKVE